MTDADLFQRNLLAFDRAFPELAQRLRAMTPPVSSVVRDQGAAVDIHLRTGLLYKQDARTHAGQQVEAYVANPFRLYYSVPMRSCFDSALSRTVFDSMMGIMRDHHIGELAARPCVDTGYLVVLGVGLGHHLPLLLERIPTRRVVIVEPFEEFLFHSLHSIDWAELIDTCQRDGRSLHVQCAPSADAIVEAVGQVFDTYNPTLLDGTYIFTHYPLWELGEAKRRLVNEMPRRMVAMGYFEDERKMLCNTATNLHRMDFRLFEGRVRPRSNVPVFLIGSGPSLQDSIEFVRQWRDHALIFSAGSSLTMLLRNGIVPDFHCELENGPEQYEKTMHVVDAFPDRFPDRRLTGLRLIASATLNPRVPPLFDEVFFYFREAVTSTTTFGRGFETLRGAAPTCANTALTAAACMGFGELYLFGFDCGFREGGDHHVKDSIYYTNGRFKSIEIKSSDTLPGNFGGTVATEPVFDWSRNVLQQCIRAYRLSRVFNCSDGALIEGAVPKVPEALEFTTPIDREAVVAQIREQSRHYGPGAFLAGFDTAPVAAELRAYVAELNAIIDGALAGEADFAAFVEEAWQMARRFAANRLASGLIYFSTIGEMKQSALFINRVTDPAARTRVTRDFLVRFRALHEDLLSQSLKIVDEIDDWIAGRAVPEWTIAGPPA